MKSSAKIIITVIVLLLILSSQACTHYRLAVKNVSPSTQFKSETVHAYFWGLSEPYIEAQNCEGNGLQIVMVKNQLFILVSHCGYSWHLVTDVN